MSIFTEIEPNLIPVDTLLIFQRVSGDCSYSNSDLEEGNSRVPGKGQQKLSVQKQYLMWNSCEPCQGFTASQVWHKFAAAIGVRVIEPCLCAIAAEDVSHGAEAGVSWPRRQSVMNETHV